MTLEEQIQETIVKYLDYYAPDHKDCVGSNSLYFIHELKKELIALIANQVREARINELERVKRYAGAWFRGDERLVKWIHIEIVDDRIAELKGDDK